MANIVLWEVGSSTAELYIEGLDLTYWGNYGTSNYPRHYKYTITVNGVSKTVTPDADNEGETTLAKFSGLSAGTTYTAIAEIKYYTSDGTALSTELSTSFKTTSSGKPSTFSWTNAKTQDGTFNLTATEWNSYTSKINEMRGYLGLSAYSFTTAVKGEDFKASMYNEARIGIQEMGSGAGSHIPTPSKGDSITAYMMNVLVTELNSAITNL